MSITDELRKFAWKECPSKFLERVTGIADRIDAEHKKAIHELYGLAENSILLPKDADGETIHIGDELEFRNGDRTMRGTVQALSDCWVVFGEGPYYGVKSCHHVQPDSWERIIRDARGDGIINQIDGRPSDFEALVERCKRLAGEDA